MKNILITEKPSVAMEFAKVLKENGIRKNGYIESFLSLAFVYLGTVPIIYGIFIHKNNKLRHRQNN